MLGMAANTKLWTLEEIFVCASYLLHLLVFFFTEREDTVYYGW